MPGFATELQCHAADPRDLNPNRTRDNLDQLKFSLRSVERHVPWLGRVVIVTCLPQVPDWLETAHPDVTVVHHDEIMDPRHLPTFNSFAIISHLHLIDGLSERFLYMEDDMLFLRDTRREQFADPDGRLLVYEHRARTPVLADLDAATASPWKLALAECNRLLDERYGTEQRHLRNSNGCSPNPAGSRSLPAAHHDATVRVFRPRRARASWNTFSKCSTVDSISYCRACMRPHCERSRRAS